MANAMLWVELEPAGLVNGARVVAVGKADAAGMKRLLSAVNLEQIVDLTGGRRRQSLLVIDSGHLVLSALDPTEIGRLLAATNDRQPAT